MKWFEDKNNNLSFGDEALDLVFHFIENFSDVYKKNIGRLPTISELEYILDLSLQVNADERFFENFEEKKVEAVKIKVGKTKKKVKYDVGDICAIPIKNGEYAFTRILLSNKPSWYLSEIFAYHSKDKAYHPYIEDSGNLLYPMFITPSDYADLNAEVVFHKIEGIDSRLKNLYYYYGLPGNYRLVKAGKDDTSHPISDLEVTEYCKQIFHMPNDIRRIIENKLEL